MASEFLAAAVVTCVVAFSRVGDGQTDYLVSFQL